MIFLNFGKKTKIGENLNTSPVNVVKIATIIDEFVRTDSVKKLLEDGVELPEEDKIYIDRLHKRNLILFQSRRKTK